jgi:hypothetical protein
MQESYVPVNTQIGIISGRDALFLDDMRYAERELFLRGSVNEYRIPQPVSTPVSYMMVFYGVLAIRFVELDSWYHLYSPSEPENICFAEVVDSQWKASLEGKVTSSHKHYYFATYDDVIEVVCEDYEFIIHTSGAE